MYVGQYADYMRAVCRVIVSQSCMVPSALDRSKPRALVVVNQWLLLPRC